MIVEQLNSIAIYLKLDFIVIKVDFFSMNLVIDFMHSIQVMYLKIDSMEVYVLVLLKKEHFIFQLVCIIAQQSEANYS